MEDVFKLDDFLTREYMKQLVKNNGRKIVNDPPNLDDILEYYRLHLQQAAQAPYIIDESQHFEMKIPVGDKDFYKMKWSLSKARYIAEKNNIRSDKLPLKLLSSFLQAYPETPKPEKDDSLLPLIAYYPPLPMKYLVLDGIYNVRMKSKKSVEKLDAVVLDPYAHMQAMAGDIYRSLFAIHFNHSLICSHLCGELSLKELKERMFPVY